LAAIPRAWNSSTTPGFTSTPGFTRASSNRPHWLVNRFSAAHVWAEKASISRSVASKRRSETLVGLCDALVGLFETLIEALVGFLEAPVGFPEQGPDRLDSSFYLYLGHGSTAGGMSIRDNLSGAA